MPASVGSCCAAGGCPSSWPRRWLGITAPKLPDDVATYVRLADMVAHHAHGEAVDGAVMLALADLCGLSASVLRGILFDLPHSGGSRRRRAEPSPLWTRETSIVRLLAQGKRYKEIAPRARRGGEHGENPPSQRLHQDRRRRSCPGCAPRHGDGMDLTLTPAAPVAPHPPRSPHAGRNPASADPLKTGDTGG